MQSDGAVRICTDLKKLNSELKRERYVLPTLDDVIHKLGGSRYFSKLDATSGFWQLPLDSETAKLTTFITPHGRYYYKRLPFGISSAPEIFQRTMEKLLKEEEEHVICYFDDILVHSPDEQQHERDLNSVMKTLKDAHLKLNQSKCELRKRRIEFLGHIISEEGVSPDPAKLEAILNMPDPSDITELRRLLGLINFLGRYVPNLSSVLRPVTELLEKDKEWTWDHPQKKALAEVRKLLTSSPTLAFFDPSKPTIVSSDASSYGLGGVLLQQHANGLKPVAYYSRTLTSCERRYAQVEKECLGVVWACEKFSRYLVGLPEVIVQTDHKPLIPLINSKDLHETPVRCQRMLMRLMRFNVKAEYVPGKELVVADALSRSPQPLKKEDEAEDKLIEDIYAHLDAVKMSWPATDRRLQEYAEESNKDSIIRQAIAYTREGWPEYVSDVEEELREFFPFRHELSEHNGLLI